MADCVLRVLELFSCLASLVAMAADEEEKDKLGERRQGCGDDDDDDDGGGGGGDLPACLFSRLTAGTVFWPDAGALGRTFYLSDSIW